MPSNFQDRHEIAGMACDDKGIQREIVHVGDVAYEARQAKREAALPQAVEPDESVTSSEAELSLTEEPNA
jgi:hypothetical protein